MPPSLFPVPVIILIHLLNSSSLYYRKLRGDGYDFTLLTYASQFKLIIITFVFICTCDHHHAEITISIALNHAVTVVIVRTFSLTEQTEQSIIRTSYLLTSSNITQCMDTLKSYY